MFFVFIGCSWSLSFFVLVESSSMEQMMSDSSRSPLAAWLPLLLGEVFDFDFDLLSRSSLLCEVWLWMDVGTYSY